MEAAIATIRRIMADRHRPWQGIPFDALRRETRYQIRRSNRMAVLTLVRRIRRNANNRGNYRSSKRQAV